LETGLSAEENNILIRYHDFLVKLIPILNRIPRDAKFIIGDRIMAIALDILENLITAYYRKHEKMSKLAEVNLQIEKIRQLLRVAHSLQYLSHKQFGIILESLDEIGRLTGGWIRSLQKE
jgi:hypothetical protein